MGIPLFNYGEDVFIRGVFARREARWLHMVPTTKRTKPGRAKYISEMQQATVLFNCRLLHFLYIKRQYS